ncbi:hypothetical protein R1sor_000867 [Riccia sorocarpa]|uniref:Post-GPI attachment to proteins factor 3 n=1 Tax=Riccia sorocarpa TaxID=122646 RepID=A0ABD3GUC6_9MARC
MGLGKLRLLLYLLLLRFVVFAWAADPQKSHLTTCVKTCEAVGCVGKSCLPSCSYLNDTVAVDGGSEQSAISPVFLQKWKKWVCKSECEYHCTLVKETQEAGFDQEAIGYREDWCLLRSANNQEDSKKLYIHLLKAAITQGISLADINEPLCAALSTLNILANLIGLVSFSRSIQRRKQANGKSSYAYSDLWTGFGLLSIVYWVSRFILHSRDSAVDRHLESSLEVSLNVYGMCLAIMRVARLRTEAARVIVAAPTIALLYTHLMYINGCFYDYGLNIQLCLGLAFAQHLLWIIWAVKNRHPGVYLLLLGAVDAFLVVSIRLGYLGSTVSLNGEADALWLCSTLLLTSIVWSFAAMDTTFQPAQSKVGSVASKSDTKKDR